MKNLDVNNDQWLGHEEGQDQFENEAKKRKASEIDCLSSRETNNLARRSEWASTWMNLRYFVRSAQ